MERRQPHLAASVVLQKDGYDLIVALLQRHGQRREPVLWGAGGQTGSQSHQGAPQGVNPSCGRQTGVKRSPYRSVEVIKACDSMELVRN